MKIEPLDPELVKSIRDIFTEHTPVKSASSFGKGMKRSEAYKKLSTWVLENVAQDHEYDPVDVNALLTFVEKEIGLTPHKYISSGCMHSMREACNCQPTHIFEWEAEGPDCEHVWVTGENLFKTCAHCKKESWTE